MSGFDKIKTSVGLAGRKAKSVVVKVADSASRHGKNAIDATAKGVAGVTEAFGEGLGTTAEYLRTGSQSFGQSSSNSDFEKTAKRRFVDISDKTSTGLEYCGNTMRRYAAHVGVVTGRFGQGALDLLVGSLGYVSISKSDIANLRLGLLEHGEEIGHRSDTLRRLAKKSDRYENPKKIYDAVIVGGVSLAEMMRIPSRVPDEVHEAFRLAYPQLATRENFVEAAGRLSPTEVVGLASGVKGKLFELKYVEELNSGGLPEGYVAAVSDTATNRGWDIIVSGPDGQVQELLQAKATASAGYVRQALDRYPEIDVVTTDEVYAQLLATGLAEGVRGSGMSLSDLDQIVGDGVQLAHEGVDWTDVAPMGFGLALVAGSLILDKKLSSMEKVEQLGDRSGRLVTAGVMAKATLIVSQLWIAALVVGVGSHLVAPRGRVKLAEYTLLSSQLELLGRTRLSDAASAT